MYQEWRGAESPGLGTVGFRQTYGRVERLHPRPLATNRCPELQRYTTLSFPDSPTSSGFKRRASKSPQTGQNFNLIHPSWVASDHRTVTPLTPSL